MIDVICRGEDFAFINIIYFYGFQYLRLREMADAAFRHDGDGYGFLYAADHFGIAHTGYTAGRPDIGGDTLQGHDGAGACRFCDPGLLRRGDIHDNAAFNFF